jgi:hypothetical protein
MPRHGIADVWPLVCDSNDILMPSYIVWVAAIGCRVCQNLALSMFTMLGAGDKREQWCLLILPSVGKKTRPWWWFEFKSPRGDGFLTTAVQLIGRAPST